MKKDKEQVEVKKSDEKSDEISTEELEKVSAGVGVATTSIVKKRAEKVAWHIA